MLCRLTRGLHSEAFHGDLLEAWREGRGNAWYWRQVLIAVAASLWRSSVSITRSPKFWSAVAAFLITASVILAVPPSVSLAMHAMMRVSLANHGKWWWPFFVHGSTWLPLTIAITVSFTRGRQRRCPLYKQAGLAR